MDLKKLQASVINRMKETLSGNVDLQKAVEKEVNGLFEGIEVVDDLWHGDMHGIPSREKIKTGPEEAASGRGASVMAREYSDFARQSGLTEEYEKLSRMMDSSRKAIKAISEQVNVHGVALQTLLDTFSKAEKDEEKDDKKEDKEDMEKAKSNLKKARTAVLKAEDEEEDKEERKEEMEKAKANLKKAKETLWKAHSESEDEKEEEEVEKSLSEVRKLSKRIAEIEAAMKKAEEDEEKEKKEKEDMEKAKAKAEEKEDKVEKENQEVWPASEKAGEIKDLVTKSVHEILDTIMGQSKSGSKPTLQKADVGSYLENRSDEIERQYDAGVLNSHEYSAAKQVLMKCSAAMNGLVDASLVKDTIDKAPSAVRNLFANV